MHLFDLLARLNIKHSLTQNPEIADITANSREVRAGTLFVVRDGARRKGKEFVAEALERGAAALAAAEEMDAPVPVIAVPDVGALVPRLAQAFYPVAPLQKAAVTGTNGKTSVVFYVAQLMNRLGVPCASMGTIGIDSPVWQKEGGMTTPDLLTICRDLHTLQEKGVKAVALEASSHGLDQGRLAGLGFQAAAFTNLTRDHLDYHQTMEAYLEAKEKLFTEGLAEGGTAVLNADAPEFARLQQAAQRRGGRVISYGAAGKELRVVSQKPAAAGQEVVLEAFGKEYALTLRVIGDFQLMNMLAAAGLCVGLGAEGEQVVPLLAELDAPTGRLQLIGKTPAGAAVFVDYAHTPDALERVLRAVRPHAAGKVHCLFGCGGDRDKGKRSQMGAIAEKLADVVCITDDNPRSEDPALIRAEIKIACPKAAESDNRAAAIHAAVGRLESGDVLVLAGKGHETGQTINGVTYAFDDRVEAALALMKLAHEPLWSAHELELALSSAIPATINAFGVSIDTRTLACGDLFVALRGEQTDGHLFVRKAVEKGAAACIVERSVEGVPRDKQIIVSQTQVALESLARFARMRSEAVFIGVTGSAGKTTTKELLLQCLAEQGATAANIGNLNNQIGVPLTLARLPLATRFAIVEMGMNHAGELILLSDLVRPDVTIVTLVSSAHREFFNSEDDIAVAKSEIFEYQNRQGTAVLNRDSPYFDLLARAVGSQGIRHIVSFGTSPKADFVLEEAAPAGEKMQVVMRRKGERHTFTLGFLGKPFALNALAVLAGVEAVGGDVARAVRTLEKASPLPGRGGTFQAPVKPAGTMLLIDDAYNANPASLKAAFASLAMRAGQRKIAILGDILELGEASEMLHLSLIPDLMQSGVSRVYTVGPMMQKMAALLPPELQGGSVPSVEELFPLLENAFQDGDVVLVKASNGMGLARLIQKLKGEK